jgi:hypothetical protein
MNCETNSTNFGEISSVFKHRSRERGHLTGHFCDTNEFLRKQSQSSWPEASSECTLLGRSKDAKMLEKLLKKASACMSLWQ